jgi:hypothetical protein
MVSRRQRATALQGFSCATGVQADLAIESLLKLREGDGILAEIGKAWVDLKNLCGAGCDTKFAMVADELREQSERVKNRRDVEIDFRAFAQVVDKWCQKARNQESQSLLDANEKEELRRDLAIVHKHAHGFMVG